MLRIGQPAPEFVLPTHLGKTVTLSDLRGMNVVLAFFPLAWTPIWTGQIPSYEADKARFAGLNTQVLGISVDSVPCLTAWADSLGGINYPLLSDFWPHGEVARRYGVLRPDGKSERAIFIIDPQGLIRYIDIHDIDQQPDNAVLFRELARLEPELAEKEVLTRRVEVKELPHGGIVMYCTPWCPDCKQAKAWLKACGLQYTEVDVFRNDTAAEQVRAWNGGSLVTPTFDIDGTILSEFDPQQLSKILKI